MLSAIQPLSLPACRQQRPPRRHVVGDGYRAATRGESCLSPVRADIPAHRPGINGVCQSGPDRYALDALWVLLTTVLLVLVVLYLIEHV